MTAITAYDNETRVGGSWLSLTGRTLLSLLFGISGFLKFVFASQIAPAIASKGLPAPELLTYAVGAFEVLAAAALIANYRIREVSFLLAAWCLLTAVLFHGFWNVSPEQQQVQLPNFLKNLALTGSFLILAGIAPRPALARTAGSSAPSHDKSEIIRAEREWTEIYGRNDADNFAKLLTSDFVYTSPVGEVVPRQTYLDNLRNRTVVMTSVQPSDEQVRFHGDAAVVTATWTVDEAYRGQPYRGPVRITRVWVQEGGHWKATAFQVTNKQV